MIIEKEDFINQYDTNLDKKEVEAIIKNLFTFVKEKIEDNNFEEIRIKNLGSLQVFKGTVKGLLGREIKRFERGYISEDELNIFKNKIKKTDYEFEN